MLRFQHTSPPKVQGLLWAYCEDCKILPIVLQVAVQATVCNLLLHQRKGAGDL